MSINAVKPDLCHYFLFKVKMYTKRELKNVSKKQVKSQVKNKRINPVKMNYFTKISFLFPIFIVTNFSVTIL